MKYPFTPEILDTMPEELAELYRSLEIKLLEEICSRLKISGQLNEVTVQDIRALRAHGIGLNEITAMIQATAKISHAKLMRLLDEVVERNQEYYTDFADLAKITAPKVIVSQAEIEAIRRQTWGTFENITGSMGFLTRKGGRLIKLPPYKMYSHILDNAEMQIQSGAISYNQAISEAIKELADHGLNAVSYESGHVDRVDVAARRAIITGIHQLCDIYTEKSMDFLETRYCEISAHSGARDKPGENPWASHKDWQGKVYYASLNGERDPLKKYKDLHDATGYGEVDGLMGANCRHIRYPFMPGVSERTYTDEQLSHIDDGLGCVFEGRKYSAYAATQKQRSIEREIRKIRRWYCAAKAADLDDDATALKSRFNRLHEKYTAFSEAAGLPRQLERL